MWDLIVLVPDHCLFVLLRIRKLLSSSPSANLTVRDLIHVVVN